MKLPFCNLFKSNYKDVEIKPGDRVMALNDGVGCLGDVYTRKGWTGVYREQLKYWDGKPQHAVAWDNGYSWAHIGDLQKLPPFKCNGCGSTEIERSKKDFKNRCAHCGTEL